MCTFSCRVCVCVCASQNTYMLHWLRSLTQWGIAYNFKGTSISFLLLQQEWETKDGTEQDRTNSCDNYKQSAVFRFVWVTEGNQKTVQKQNLFTGFPVNLYLFKSPRDKIMRYN